MLQTGLLMFRHAVVEYSILQGEDGQASSTVYSNGRVPLFVSSEEERRQTKADKGFYYTFVTQAL